MTIKNQPCPCLHSEPLGNRAGPNAKTSVFADPKCPFCRGAGLLTLDVAHDPPPYQRGADWNATIQDSETGPQGFGNTKQAAVDDLMVRKVEVSN